MQARSSVLVACLLGVGCGLASPVHPDRSAVNADPRAPSEGCQSELVSIGSLRGVVFTTVCNGALADSVQRAASEKVIGYFRPSAGEITMLDSRLRATLEHGLNKPDSLARLELSAEDRAEQEWGIRGALAGI